MSTTCGAPCVASLVIALATAACSPGPPAENAASQARVDTSRSGDLADVALPRLAEVAAATRDAIEERYAEVTAAGRDRRGPEAAVAFGRLGMMLMAAEFFESALPCFRNAAVLAPGDARWPYYLAHVHRRLSDPARAAKLFEQTLTIDPGQASASWWLASVYLDLNRPEEAEAFFGRTQTVKGFQAPALYGLGRAALAQQQYGAAAGYFEQALSINPDAGAARYPLGLAYQKLGRTRDAEVQMQRRTSAEIRPPDPFLDALAGLVESSLAHHALGVEASVAGDWPKAIEHFRRAVALDPEAVSAHVNLAVAFHRAGGQVAALDAVRRAIDVSPRDARAHYVLGAVLTSLGRDAAAILAYGDAARAEAGFMEAQFSRAELLRQNGRHQQALAGYAAALDLAPALADAQFGSALSMVQLGRYRDARDRLVEGMRAHPNEPRFPHALARVLATAPDSAVRDGARALELTQQLLAADATVDRATTMAMALAAAGRYREAADWQRQAIAAVTRDDQEGSVVAGMRRNLEAFERRQPLRQPWPDDDAIRRPAPRAAPGFVD